MRDWGGGRGREREMGRVLRDRRREEGKRDGGW